MSEIDSFIWPRKYYFAEEIKGSSQEDPCTVSGTDDRIPVESYDEANLVSSETIHGDHMPVLDLDVRAFLVPSSTPGNSHLYINHNMLWEDYVKLITVMAEVGILEEGYVKASIARGATFVRRPGVYKEDKDV